MAAKHSRPIRQRLELEGLNLGELESSGQLVSASAEELIPTFLTNGILDERHFKTKFGAMIENAKRFDGKLRAVRVFGEMVDLLWQSDARITQRIEELWNEVIEAHSVPLLCGYSLAGIKPGTFPQALVDCHSHDLA